MEKLEITSDTKESATANSQESICRSRAGTIKTKPSIELGMDHDAKKRHKKIRNRIMYVTVILLAVGGILTPIIIAATKKPPVYHVSHRVTSKPVTISGRTRITTVGMTTTTNTPFDRCERRLVALTKQLSSYVTSLVVADLNHDNKTDIVCSCNSQIHFYIVFNLGNDKFTDPILNPLSAPVTSMIIADINADNNLDIIVVLGNPSHHLKLFFNNGQGVFKKTTDLTSVGSMATSSIAVSDVNDDGRPDILISAAYENIIGIYLNKGNQKFDKITTYPTDSYPMSIYAADLNGDKKPDIIVANAKSNNIGIRFNQGDGSFSAPVSYSTDIGPIFVMAADINRDNKSDIITVNYFSNNIVIYLNNGGGNFTQHSNFSGQANAVCIALSDYDSDGSIDIIVPNHHTNNVDVFFNNRLGIFKTSTTYYTYPLPRIAVAADLNNDNKPDIVLANGNYITAILSRCY